MALDFLLPRSYQEFIAILFLALALDFAYPRHEGVLYYIHPVHTSYTMALKLHRSSPRTRMWGIIIWFAVVVSHITLYSLALYIANLFSRVAWVILSAYILKVSTSFKLLYNHVRNVYMCLYKGDLACARTEVSKIVRRDVKNLGEGHVASAAIESLFESLVDGFASPLLYYLLFGPIGALTQRIANTLDSALGYKDEEFRDVGWFSAKTDTAINFVPARLEALLIILLSPIGKGSMRRSWDTYRRYRRATESINAGHPLSAVSGYLGVRLEKIGAYVIGREFTLPTGRDIERALRFAILNAVTYVLIINALSITIYLARQTICCVANW
ncbi:MAG: cobalamin biosynthesis protein [Ignisphaera sp.]